MYQAHWGLERTPFPSGLEPHLFYEGLNQRESLARLRFLADNGRRLGLVLGEPGLGKSLLLEMFARECRQQSRAVAQLSLLGLSSRECWWQICAELQARVQLEDDLARLFRKLTERIVENRLQGISTVLLLDDADQAGPDLLQHLLRLAHFKAADEGWLTLVLTANRGQANRLGSKLLDLIDLRIDLQPWDELDTIGYLQLALVEAGSERPLFADQALSKIYQLTGGVPRRVNRLADYALLAGSSSGQELVCTATIQSAYDAIQVPIGT
ncbi:MAG: AAA family ATPase [Planctomycetales bacterium]|nr:AAA family ATPase [Planctomycetales bacterium]